MKQELQEILKTMDIPPLRQFDMRWLQRNLGVRNSNHPDFTKAMQIIKQLIKEDKDA